MPGAAAALAADALGALFDAEAASAILAGDVTVDLTPEEVVLGVLPLLSLALFVWFREHHPGVSAVSSVVALAQAMDLCPGGSFALDRGLGAFFRAYYDALATREEFDVDRVVQGIVQAVAASQAHHDALRCTIVDLTGRVTDRWLDFGDGLSQVYVARREARGGGRALYDMSDLASTVNTLKRFMRADAARSDRTAATASPLHTATIRVVHAAPSAPGPPALAPDDWRSSMESAIAAQAAQTAEVLSVLRAHGSAGPPTPVSTRSPGHGRGPRDIGPDRPVSRDSPDHSRASRENHAPSRATRDSPDRPRASRDSPDRPRALLDSYDSPRATRDGHDSSRDSHDRHGSPRASRDGPDTSRDSHDRHGSPRASRDGRDAGREGAGRSRRHRSRGGAPRSAGSDHPRGRGDIHGGRASRVSRGGSDDSDEPHDDPVDPPATASLGGAPGAHSSLTFYVLGTTEPIIATKALARLGWNVTFLGAEARGELTAPGFATPFPLTLAANGDYHLDLVADPRLPDGMLTIAGSDPAHRGLRRHSFLIDSGADCNLMDSATACELLTMVSLPPIGITGVTGAKINTRGAGTLDLAFFIGGRLLTRPMGGAGATVFHMPATARVRQARACAFTPLRTASTVSERFNCNSGEALIAFRDAEGHTGISSFPVDPHVQYGGSVAQRARGKAPARRRELNLVSAAIRDHAPRGSVWWTDLSNPHPPDYKGDMYARLFAEEGTGYVRLLFCATKSTADLLEHLANMERWVTKMVPGGRFMVLRSDFGSELVRQGHGNDMVVEALSRWCASRPGFRVVPVAPHSPSRNKSENTWGLVHGHAFSNACRSRTGTEGWSLMYVGAEFQHNHLPGARSNTAAVRAATRSFALTGRPCDLSTMVGYVGQGCWSHDYSGKANAFRARARAGLYVCPAEECSGQLFFDLRSSTLQVVEAVSFASSPDMVLGLLADSGLYAPHGAFTAPPADIHTARMRSLLTPESPLDDAVVVTDPVTGLPLSVVRMVPMEAADGSLVMLPRDSAPPPAYVAPVPCPAWLDDGDARADAAQALADAASAPPGPATPPVPIGRGMAPVAARALADILLAPGASTMAIWVDPHALRRGDSAPRYAACVGAATIGRTSPCTALTPHRRVSPTNRRVPTSSGPSNVATSAMSRTLPSFAAPARVPSSITPPSSSHFAATTCSHTAAWRPLPLSTRNPPSPPPSPRRSAPGTATTRAYTLRPTLPACVCSAPPWLPTSPPAGTITPTTTHQMSTGPAGPWTRGSPCSSRPHRLAWSPPSPCKPRYAAVNGIFPTAGVRPRSRR